MMKSRCLIGMFMLVSLSVAGQSNMRMEIPKTKKGVSEQIIEHKAYTLSYNKDYNNPNWVAWELLRKETYGNTRRAKDFQGDQKINEKNRVQSFDYSGSKYDRGHMCPAGDNRWDPRAMTECFYMSNMCPQDHELNKNWWNNLEIACRRWARREGKVYIVCGPVYKADRKTKTMGKKVKSVVPDGFFKVVLSVRKGYEKAIGFYYANNSSDQPMDKAVRTVDQIEQLTGMDFFSKLDDRVENKLEAKSNLRDWDPAQN